MECSGEDGRIVLGQCAAGGATTDFYLSRLGVYHVRLARRNGEAEERARAAVYAAFAEDDWNSAAFREAMDAIDVIEEHLVRFWPAATDHPAGHQ
ncbi:hypothetical protein [Actinoplanes sp. NPDC051859]|uniref:hypothetical protein n=1 Tax=Actinoplanes sp. NPDC051859 TaxID=3363909 RepID=UPI00379B2948